MLWCSTIQVAHVCVSPLGCSVFVQAGRTRLYPIRRLERQACSARLREPLPRALTRRRAARRASPRRSAARPRRPHRRPPAARARRAAGATRLRGAGALARQRTRAKTPRPRPRACRRAARLRGASPTAAAFALEGAAFCRGPGTAGAMCAAGARTPTEPCEGEFGGREYGSAHGWGVRSGAVQVRSLALPRRRRRRARVGTCDV